MFALYIYDAIGADERDKLRNLMKFVCMVIHKVSCFVTIYDFVENETKNVLHETHFTYFTITVLPSRNVFGMYSEENWRQRNTSYVISAFTNFK